MKIRLDLLYKISLIKRISAKKYLNLLPYLSHTSEEYDINSIDFLNLDL